MKIEAAIKQSKPMLPLQKAVINLIYTYHWQNDRTVSMMKPFGITPQQYNVLRILRGKHPEAVPMGAVKAVMLDKNSDLTRLSDRMLTKEWVRRETNPCNRREVLLSLTGKGIELMEKISATFEEMIKDWQPLTDDEAEQLSELLDKLRGD